MNPELVGEYDKALVELEAIGGGGPPVEADSRLAQRMAGARATSPQDWLSEWVTGPLSRLEVFETLWESTQRELSESERELSLLSEEIERRRAAMTEVEPFQRREAVLLTHWGNLRHRVEGQAERVARARRAVARVLSVALRLLAEDALGTARQGVPDVAARAQRLLGPLETYRRLVEAAERLTGGLALPALATEEVEGLRAAAALDRLRHGGFDDGRNAALQGRIWPPRLQLVARATHS